MNILLKGLKNIFNVEQDVFFFDEKNLKDGVFKGRVCSIFIDHRTEIIYSIRTDNRTFPEIAEYCVYGNLDKSKIMFYEFVSTRKQQEITEIVNKYKEISNGV